MSVRDIHGFVRLSLQKRPVTIPMRGFLWGADVGCFRIWDLIDMRILSRSSCVITMECLLTYFHNRQTGGCLKHPVPSNRLETTTTP